MSDVAAIDEFGKMGVGPYCRMAMAQALRLISPSIEGVSAVQQLLNVAVSWEVRDAPCSAGPAPLARLQSPRRRGVAPMHPDRERFESMRDGTLIVYPGGFVLEPEDKCRPCINVARSTVDTATFYRDAFDVTLSSRERLVVRTSDVEQIDSIFQAYFWSPMG